jgi:hypothetical protein
MTPVHMYLTTALSYYPVLSYYCRPCLTLKGLTKPSIAVRSCPVLFTLPAVASTTTATGMTDLPYRSVFAVATTDRVLLYDTQSAMPLAMVAHLHLAPLSDLCWLPDGSGLMISSLDGYMSKLHFDAGEIGTPMLRDAVPVAVRRANPLIYGCDEPEAATATTATTTNAGSSGAQVLSPAAATANTGGAAAAAAATPVAAAVARATAPVPPVTLQASLTASLASAQQQQPAKRVKKTIVPTLVSPAPSSTSTITTTASNGTAKLPAAVNGGSPAAKSSTQQSSPAVAVTGNNGAVTPAQKLKRRITPTLVGEVGEVRPFGAQSAAASNGSTVKGQATAEAAAVAAAKPLKKQKIDDAAVPAAAAVEVVDVSGNGGSAPGAATAAATAGVQGDAPVTEKKPKKRVTPMLVLPTA